MSKETNIAWCDSTINFWTGCTMVPIAGGLKESGCLHCYAKTRDDRHMIEPVSHWGKGAKRLKHKGAVATAVALNRKPWICDCCGKAAATAFSGLDPLHCPDCAGLSYHRRRIFSLSLGDWLDEEVPIEWLAEMLDTIRQCDQVTWILCTKRPELWAPRVEGVLKWLEANDCKWPADGCSSLALRNYLADWFVLRHRPSHIILLASVENQAAADLRIPQLLAIPAVCRGLSLEPLLGPVELSDVTMRADAVSQLGKKAIDGIDWLIIGGESGDKARPCNVDWVRSLVRQGQAADVAVFVKQLGANVADERVVKDQDDADAAVVTLPPPHLKDKKGGEPSEWPADLRVQQFPEVSGAGFQVSGSERTEAETVSSGE